MLHGVRVQVSPSAPCFKLFLQKLMLVTVGEWRSLVAHLFWVQGVVGSNPISPTIYSILFIFSLLNSLFLSVCTLIIQKRVTNLCFPLDSRSLRLYTTASFFNSYVCNKYAINTVLCGVLLVQTSETTSTPV